jgi:hypothetical protein
MRGAIIMATYEERMADFKAKQELKIQERIAYKQKQLEQFISDIKKTSPETDTQTCVNLFFLRKLAEIDQQESNKVIAEDLQKWHYNQFKH